MRPVVDSSLEENSVKLIKLTDSLTGKVAGGKEWMNLS